MGSTFGRTDGSATNDVLNGQTVATGTAGAQTVADPNKGLSGGQMRNRKLASIGGQTLGAVANPITSPMMNSGGSSGGPQSFTFANNQPAYQPPTPMPLSPPAQGTQTFKQMKDPFFGY